MTEPKKKQPKPIPLSVLTGFLGSGKTTLLNWVLGHEQFSNSIVIINEFGDVGLDHLFVQKADERMIEMSSGCLCCTIRGDLCDTLEQLLRDRDNDRIKKFESIIIETTGLADPAPIVQTLISHPYLSKRFRMNSLITTIDAQHGEATLDAHKEAVKQAAMADVLVMTKTDIEDVNDHQINALADKLFGLNKTAHRILPKEDNLLAAFLTENTYAPDSNNPDIMNWLHGAANENDNEAGSYCDIPNDGAQGSQCKSQSGCSDDNASKCCDQKKDDQILQRQSQTDQKFKNRDVNVHSDTIRSFSFTHDGAVDQEIYDLFLDMLRERFGAQLLRYKALVRIASHDDRPLVSHGVHHMFYPPAILDKWPVEDRKTRIVCITDGVDEARIYTLFKAFAGSAESGNKSAFM